MNHLNFKNLFLRKNIIMYLILLMNILILLIKFLSRRIYEKFTIYIG